MEVDYELDGTNLSATEDEHLVSQQELLDFVDWEAFCHSWLDSILFRSKPYHPDRETESSGRELSRSNK